MNDGPRIPKWIPAEDRERLDLSELADGEELAEKCEQLGEQLGVHVAAYRRGARARPTGLCCTFKYAPLSFTQSRALKEAEQAQQGIILVAYARPLERW